MTSLHLGRYCRTFNGFGMALSRCLAALWVGPAPVPIRIRKPDIRRALSDSLMPQGDYGIDACRAARGDVASRQGYECEQRSG
jgi:hypothetical protein